MALTIGIEGGGVVSVVSRQAKKKGRIGMHPLSKTKFTRLAEYLRTRLRPFGLGAAEMSARPNRRRPGALREPVAAPERDARPAPVALAAVLPVPASLFALPAPQARPSRSSPGRTASDGCSFCWRL